ncbi:hypothetical protein Y900_017515 [Mycolicibacterium aromaticivorans JS19b1 = JCM 16368]|uniref:Uncharacterized protein n=2 Tax=Mycolicibacterium aromaticivorans TaxID=318425 RepID=A0A064CPE6_9MYCO|nr:hypothetical protein Y900_017515 [Mycolicibacterium aromaticivorans JS19b1 = JCM 16368]
MNGMSGSRRLASPVRITLKPTLGGDIDGAWWPHSFALARELPELIEALHPVLGEIVDIKINWSSSSGTPVLKTLTSGAVSMHGWNDRQHRLMIVSGRTGCARLLVVPSSTSVNLGRLVIRRAAAMDPGAEHDSSMCDIADAVIRAAEAECSLWSAQLLEAAAKVEASAP